MWQASPNASGAPESDANMDKREQFLHDLRGENRQAALLIAQVGGMPTELQLVIQIADYDEQAGGLRPLRSYIVRASGVLEHHISTLGTTVDEVHLLHEHPLLYSYVEPPAAVFFRGSASNAPVLLLDLMQAHASTFGPWRRFPEFFNVKQPLLSLLQSGGGLLGQMPESLARRVVTALEHHKLEHKVMVGTPHVDTSKNPYLQGAPLSLLLLGDSYVIAYAFSFDEIGKV